ncbi:unnamed protein product [Fusarium venenatum]|uniref:Uncharacterized protein n=1 Tax=Fusarium venenatum TaxID=56646 RepID=A0A2L2TBA6_9HYPO|nr:uncharacterized protein FVRRES_08321 [Fusarium venenatum]CEI68244.1 unnamed protein product [Fusarium venenatum]
MLRWAPPKKRRAWLEVSSVNRRNSLARSGRCGSDPRIGHPSAHPSPYSLRSTQSFLRLSNKDTRIVTRLPAVSVWKDTNSYSLLWGLAVCTEARLVFDSGKQ